MTADAPLPPPTSSPAAKRPGEWLLEGIFIAISVMLGFAVSEYGESRRERELARRMLASIQAEVEHNQSVLKPFLAFHRAWSEAIDKLDPAAGSGPGIDAFFETRPPLPPGLQQNVPFLRHAAWDTATSTGALRLIDYDLAAGLSEMYALQGYAAATFSNLFAQSAFYDAAARSATIKLSQTAMTEMLWTEGTLSTLYEKHLPAIRHAAAGR